MTWRFRRMVPRLVIYAGSNPEVGDAVWVVNVSSSQIESRHPTVYSQPTIRFWEPPGFPPTTGVCIWRVLTI